MGASVQWRQLDPALKQCASAVRDGEEKDVIDQRQKEREEEEERRDIKKTKRKEKGEKEVVIKNEKFNFNFI